MKKKILAIALAAVMVFGITACSGEATARDEGGATTEASASNKVKKDVYSGEQEIKIAYVAHDLSTPNNQAWLEGIQREIAPWSDHVTVQAFNGESSAETQVTIMTDIINQQYDAIIPYIEKKKLDPWTHSKAIQKAIESYRITPGQKEYLRTFRLHKPL